MFTYKRLIILLLAFSTIWSCTKDFEQTNIKYSVKNNKDIYHDNTAARCVQE